MRNKASRVLHGTVLMFVLCVSFTSSPQDGPSRKDIDEAVQKGANYLIGKHDKGVSPQTFSFELILYTLIHADLDPKKVEPLKKGIHDLINYPYPEVKDAKKAYEQRVTYRMGIRAMALHSLLVKIKDNTYYRHLRDQVGPIQKKIAESAQFLVDTQLDNGQWHYAGVLKNTPEVSALTTGSPAPESQFNAPASKEAWQNATSLTKTLYRLVPKYGADPKSKMTDLGKPVELGKQIGDNSNTQYGILGLIAAEKSGVEVPRTTWEKTLKWFESTSNPDGGYGYVKGVSSYGGMTTAAAVALAAGYKYTGKDYMNEVRVQAALKWLGKNFSAADNPGFPYGGWPHKAFYYYLYGLERVGAFSGLRKFGEHDWYAEGAAQLLKLQEADGSWKGDQGPYGDTAFAILFLKRATSDMIDTGTAGIDAR